MEQHEKRLLLVRDTVYEARRLADGRPLDFDCMRAVWLADLAVELTLATIASDNGLHPKQANQDFRFEDYLSAIGQQVENAKLQSLKKYFPDIRSLHKNRNRVHDGVAISVDNTKRDVTKAETFIRAALAGLYNTDLDGMSLTSFLVDTKAKKHLELAQEFANERDYDQAALHIAVAFEDVKKELSAQLSIGRKTRVWEGGAERRTRAFSANSNLAVSDPLVARISFAIEVSRFGIPIPEAIDFLDSLLDIALPFGADENDIKSWVVFDHEPYRQKIVVEQIRFLTELTYRLQQNWRNRTSFTF